MTTTTLGTWRKPPLAYVVAELVISPYYSMAAKVPGLQDWLRSTFPKTVEGQELDSTWFPFGGIPNRVSKEQK